MVSQNADVCHPRKKAPDSQGKNERIFLHPQQVREIDQQAFEPLSLFAPVLSPAAGEVSSTAQKRKETDRHVVVMSWVLTMEHAS